MTAGDIYTIAGSSTGAVGTSGDGGAGTSALLSDPSGSSVDGAGNLYIADTDNNRIQEAGRHRATQWGTAMTGRGHLHRRRHRPRDMRDTSGDGGPATERAAGRPGRRRR